jgi:fucose 4-O-acetylase-like acetyltransferase|tara:strand:- start:6933 stop:8000 length:1068 start_codon:yes stop_codon:yes gene_type:complete
MQKKQQFKKIKMTQSREKHLNTSTTTRDDWIDCAKGIGIILVVLGHVLRGLVNSNILEASQLAKIVDSVIYTFHMPLFFFLSGLFFISSKKRSTPKKFWIKKIDTIAYPYLLWCILQGSLEVALSGHTNNTTTIQDIFSIPWAPIAHFWFLHALFLCFVISSTLERATPKQHTNLAIIFGVTGYFLPLHYEFPSAVNNVLNNYIYFAAAVWVSININSNTTKNKREALIIYPIILFACGQYYLHASGHTYQDRGFLTLALALIGVLIVITVSKSLKPPALVFFARLGVASMSIYLAHILAASGTRIVLYKLGGVTDYHVHIIAGLTAGLAAPYAMHVLIQRYKIGRITSFSKPRN